MIIMWLPNQSESVCNLLYKQKDWILTKQEVVKAILLLSCFFFVLVPPPIPEDTDG